MPVWQQKMRILTFGATCLLFGGLGLVSLSFLVNFRGSTASFLLSSLMMTVLSALMLIMQVWFWRRSINQFTLEGRALRYSTLGRPEIQFRALSEVIAVTPQRGRSGLSGCRLKFRDGEQVYLPYYVPNAEAAALLICKECGLPPLL